MSAFAEVNTSAKAWTVRVNCDSQSVALGTVVASDGWILTKGSELQGNITCLFNDGQELSAEFIGYDQENDLALLKVDATELPAIEWADENRGIGRWVVTVGMGRSPAGVGIISAERIEVRSERGTGVLGIELVQEDGPPQVKAIVPERALNVLASPSAISSNRLTKSSWPAEMNWSVTFAACVPETSSRW